MVALCSALLPVHDTSPEGGARGDVCGGGTFYCLVTSAYAKEMEATVDQSPACILEAEPHFWLLERGGVRIVAVSELPPNGQCSPYLLVFIWTFRTLRPGMAGGLGEALGASVSASTRHPNLPVLTRFLEALFEYLSSAFQKRKTQSTGS